MLKLEVLTLDRQSWKEEKVLEKGLIKRIGDRKQLKVGSTTRKSLMSSYPWMDWRGTPNTQALPDNYLMHDVNVVGIIPLGRLEEDS